MSNEFTIIEIGKPYKLFAEFFPMYNISRSSWDRRKDDLKEWLKEFFNYELIENTTPMMIIIKEVYGDYRPLPRKINTKELAIRKHNDYENYVKGHLTHQYQCMSKRRMAQMAINDFAYDEYGHSSSEGIAKRYTGPVMEQYGEQSGEYHWVWYKDYSVATKEALCRWAELLKKYRAEDKQIVSAFHEDAEVDGHESMDAVKNRYQKAREEFKKEFGDVLVRVGEWRLQDL